MPERAMRPPKPVVDAPHPSGWGGQKRVRPAAWHVGCQLEGGAPAGCAVEGVAHEGVQRGWSRPVVHWVGVAGAAGLPSGTFQEQRCFFQFKVLIRRMNPVEPRVKFRPPPPPSPGPWPPPGSATGCPLPNGVR